MTRTLIAQSWTQTFCSPVRMLLVATWFGYPLLKMAAESSSSLDESSAEVFGIAVLAGLCGLDAANGNLRCILSRPVSRARYVLSRFAAGWSAVAALGLAHVVIQIGIVAAFGGEGFPPSRTILLVVLSVLVAATGLTAAIVLASVTFAGLGDVAAVVLLTIGLSAFQEFAPPSPWATHVVTLTASLLGKVDGSDGAALATIRVLSNAALALLLAVVVMNRKDLGAEARA